MLRRNKIVRASALAVAMQFAAFVEAQEDQASPWCDDFDVAVARAKKEGKDLLVDFTGSDWCGWCMKLDAEVFQKPFFLNAVKDKYVLVALDYPRKDAAKAKVPNPRRNAEVAGMYGIGGYPTVLLLTSDGDMIAQTSYEEGGPENYVKNLAKLEQEGRQHLQPMREYQARYKKAKSKKIRAEIVREIVQQLSQMTREHYGVRGMARIAAEALKLDKRNKLHLKNSAVRAIILAGVAGDDVLAVARKDKKNKDGLYELLAADAVMKASDIEQSKAAIKVIEAVDKLGFQDTDIASFVLTNAAIWADELLKDSAKAKTMAKKALAVGVSGAERARLNKILDR